MSSPQKQPSPKGAPAMYAWADAGSLALVFTATSRTMEITFKIKYYIFTHVWYMYICVCCIHENAHCAYLYVCGIHEYVCAYLYVYMKVRQWMSSVVLNLL